MVHGVMLMMRGVQIGTLYNLLGHGNLSGYNSVVVPKINQSTSCLVDETMLWYQRMGYIGE